MILKRFFNQWSGSNMSILHNKVHTYMGGFSDSGSFKAVTRNTDANLRRQLAESRLLAKVKTHTSYTSDGHPFAWSWMKKLRCDGAAAEAEEDSDVLCYLLNGAIWKFQDHGAHDEEMLRLCDLVRVFIDGFEDTQGCLSLSFLLRDATVLALGCESLQERKTWVAAILKECGSAIMAAEGWVWKQAGEYGRHCTDMQQTWLRVKDATLFWSGLPPKPYTLHCKLYTLHAKPCKHSMQARFSTRL